MPENKLEPNIILRGLLFPGPVQLVAVAQLSDTLRYGMASTRGHSTSLFPSLFLPEKFHDDYKKFGLLPKLSEWGRYQ